MRSPLRVKSKVPNWAAAENSEPLTALLREEGENLTVQMQPDSSQIETARNARVMQRKDHIMSSASIQATLSHKSFVCMVPVCLGSVAAAGRLGR